MNNELAFLNIQDVSKRVSLSASTIRRMISEGRFPSGHRLGQVRRVWRSDEVTAWIQKQGPAHNYNIDVVLPFEQKE